MQKVSKKELKYPGQTVSGQSTHGRGLGMPPSGILCPSKGAHWSSDRKRHSVGYF